MKEKYFYSEEMAFKPRSEGWKRNSTVKIGTNVLSRWNSMYKSLEESPHREPCRLFLAQTYLAQGVRRCWDPAYVCSLGRVPWLGETKRFVFLLLTMTSHGLAVALAWGRKELLVLSLVLGLQLEFKSWDPRSASRCMSPYACP